MTNKEKIAQLKDLIKDRKTFLTGDPQFDEIFLADIEALEWAINKITVKRSKKHENSYRNKDFTANF